MTWEELASKIITQMTPEERQKEVKYVESWDDASIIPIGLRQTNEVIELYDERIEPGEWYLW